MAIGESFGPRQEFKVVQTLPPVIRFTGPLSDEYIAAALLAASNVRLIKHAPSDGSIISVPFDALRPDLRKYFSAGGDVRVGGAPLVLSLNLDRIADQTLFLRELYRSSSEGIQTAARALLKAGKSEEFAARWVVRQRNLLKHEIRLKGPALFRKIAEARNLKKYGDPLGPNHAGLRTGQRGPGMANAAAKTDAQILEDVAKTSRAFNVGAKALKVVSVSLGVATFVLTAMQDSPDALDPLPQSDEALVATERARLRLGIPAGANIDRHGHLKKSSYLQIDVMDFGHAGDEIDQETEEILWWIGVPITYKFEGVSWTVPGR